MNFFDTLVARTAQHRAELVSTPIIQGCLRGEVSLGSYLAFLHEAYHHVRHTVPLFEALIAVMPQEKDWLRPALDEYIE